MRALVYLKQREVFTIKIAVLHHALGRFGGGEKMAILHSIYLKKLGFDIELFYNGPVHHGWKKRTRSKMTLNTLPFGLPPSFKDFRNITKLIRHLKSFDVILIHHHICPFLAYYLTIFLKSRLVWYCGEPLRALWEDWLSSMDYRELSCTVKPTSIEFYGEAFTSIFLSNKLYDISVSFLRALDKATARRYSTIIANSNYTKKVVERIYGLDKPTPVIHPGVETQQHTQDATNEELGSYILAVGAMIPMKNHFNLLRAFYSLRHQYRSKVKLVIIGSGPLENETRSLTRKLNLKNVVFQSRVSEQILNKYYANCSFVVHVALNEPFGLVPVEAALHGKPSIVSNNGGTSEFVIHGKNGLLVNPHSPKDIANAMECLINDKRLTAEMGFKAKERVLKEFTIEKSTENLAREIKLLR